MMRALALAIAVLVCGCGSQTADRIRLTSDTTAYVDPAGDDTNDCLSPDTACATLQHVWEHFARNYDLAGYSLTIKLKNDTDYTQVNGGLETSECMIGQREAAAVTIDGGPAPVARINGTVPEPDRQSYLFEVGEISTSEMGLCVRFRLQNMRFTHPNGGALNVNGGIIDGGPGIDFGPVRYAHVRAIGPGGNVLFFGQLYKISGGAQSHMQGISGGVAVNQGSTITCVGNFKFDWAFAVAKYTGQFYGADATYNNCENVNGTRWVSDLNGMVQTLGVMLPGDVAGVASRGGQID